MHFPKNTLLESRPVLWAQVPLSHFSFHSHSFPFFQKKGIHLLLVWQWHVAPGCKMSRDDKQRDNSQHWHWVEKAVTPINYFECWVFSYSFNKIEEDDNVIIVHRVIWGINLGVQRNDWYCCNRFSSISVYLVMWTSFLSHKNEKLEFNSCWAPSFWAVSYHQRFPAREFSGSPVVRTPRFRFHCQGPGFDPWLGN